ncbi:MAG: Uma2 family endonuclease [Caldilinea sp.]|nr:Uma2 family endonuclease [Caldilinea sp.]MDW8441145.1 Uma2 family endonuclease [Caldilineaceae bacterium]
MMNSRASIIFAAVRTFAEDSFAAPQSEQKFDLIERVFVMASPIGVEHEDLMMLLGTLMCSVVAARRLGLAFEPNVAYRLSETNVYQPDISFFGVERWHRVGEAYVDGAADLAVEIVSPSSRQSDLGRFGAEEHRPIDPIERTVTLYVNGEMTMSPPEEGALRSRVLPGFGLRPKWIFPSESVERQSEPEIAWQQGLV